MIKVNEHIITPTIFPDNTSQVWQLDPNLLDSKSFNIVWEFENEGELFHLQQLVQLLKYGRVPCPINLHMPYLPYGRQDKDVSNDSTFALKTFCNVIDRMNFDKVSTLDAHSMVAADWVRFSWR